MGDFELDTRVEGGGGRYRAAISLPRVILSGKHAARRARAKNLLAPISRPLGHQE